MKIKLGDDFSRFNSLVGKKCTIEEGGATYTGIVSVEHPGFDKSLIRNEIYYGPVIYWLDVLTPEAKKALCYDLKEPMYFIDQTVDYIHHNGNRKRGKITYIETHYRKRDDGTSYGYHIYAIVNPGTKRSFWIGEDKIFGEAS